MNDTEAIMIIASSVPSLVMVAMTAWIKSSINKIDQINIIATKLDNVVKEMGKLEERFNKHDGLREDMILQKAEMKTQWARINDIERRVRDL